MYATISRQIEANYKEIKEKYKRLQHLSTIVAKISFGFVFLVKNNTTGKSNELCND